jgi:hypothetical protein
LIFLHGIPYFLQYLFFQRFFQRVICKYTISQSFRLKLNHPYHEDDYIPCLSPRFISSFSPFFGQLSRICVEDVDKDGWPVLLAGLSKYGSSLKVMHLETISEKEPFVSTIGFGAVFSQMPKLEYVRMEVFLTYFSVHR